MNELFDGCFFTARKLFDSSIWLDKPAWWSKVWIYIIGNVNHKTKAGLERGEGFFTYKQIYNGCGLWNDGLHRSQCVDGVVRWLKLTTQITTRKTTRGFVVKVLKYAIFQDLNSYKNDTENDTKNDKETTRKRNTNDTIYMKEECKNDKKELNTMGEDADYVVDEKTKENAEIEITDQRKGGAEKKGISIEQKKKNAERVTKMVNYLADLCGLARFSDNNQVIRNFGWNFVRKFDEIGKDNFQTTISKMKGKADLKKYLHIDSLYYLFTSIK